MIMLLSIMLIMTVYVMICWINQCKLNRMCFPQKNLDVINLGSTYAYYDFDYSDLPIKGMNLANIPQYLDYDLILLNKYVKYLKKDAKVFIVLPNFVFVSKSTQTDRKEYYEALRPREIQNFSMKKLIGYIYASAIEPFVHVYDSQRNKWKGYNAPYEEKMKHAERRVLDWEKKLGVPNVSSNEITNELRKCIDINIKRVENLINMCNQNDVEPIIIIPPVSSIMRAAVSKECLYIYLYEPVNKIINDKNIRVLDYMYDDELENVEFYLNSDCLNDKGVRIFMRKLYKDIWCNKDER